MWNFICRTVDNKKNGIFDSYSWVKQRSCKSTNNRFSCRMESTGWNKIFYGIWDCTKEYTGYNTFYRWWNSLYNEWHYRWIWDIYLQYTGSSGYECISIFCQSNISIFSKLWQRSGSWLYKHRDGFTFRKNYGKKWKSYHKGHWL